MMRLPCPYCGARDAFEFTWGGEADTARPEDPNSCSDEAWGRYLFMRRNPKGESYERWCHTYGCGQWFVVWRNTVTHEIERAERLCSARRDTHG